MEMAVEYENSDDPALHGTMLSTIRRRRWFLWGMILIYLPASLTTLQYTESYKLLGSLFLIWLILLCVAVSLMACSKCPRCGKNFHMRNSTLSFFGNCRHCGLGIKNGRGQG
jgi:hypothetical protein